MDDAAPFQEIGTILADPGINRLAPDLSEPARARPLIGVSRGDDPLYPAFLESIGSFYRTPLEAFRTAFPESDSTAAYASATG